MSQPTPAGDYLQVGPNNEERTMSIITHPETDDWPATMTISEAAEILGISRSAGYRAAGKGEIPTIRIGGRLLVPTAKLRALLGLSEATT